jgi:hypothetical protein
MADTLISPLNDSFVDFDVPGCLDPATFVVTGVAIMPKWRGRRGVSAGWSTVV